MPETVLVPGNMNKTDCSLTRFPALSILAKGGRKITGLNLKDPVLTRTLPGSWPVTVNKSSNLSGLHFPHLSDFSFKNFK